MAQMEEVHIRVKPNLDEFEASLRALMAAALRAVADDVEKGASHGSVSDGSASDGSASDGSASDSVSPPAPGAEIIGNLYDQDA